MTPTSTTTIDSIRAGAEAREALGQAAQYELLPDGTHRVSFFDRAARKLRVGIGRTAGEAVGQVKQQHGGNADAI
jgi:hypothetical protein